MKSAITMKININTGHIGFGVAPRLNAAGRLTHASIAVELLLATDKQTAHQKALYLDKKINTVKKL